VPVVGDLAVVEAEDVDRDEVDRLAGRVWSSKLGAIAASSRAVSPVSQNA
jgi:hypothetical protein